MSPDRDLFGFGHRTSLRIISIKCLRWPPSSVDARIRRSPTSSWTIGRGMLRQLLSGAKTVRVMEKQLEVRARMELLDALLAHAGRSEILGWHRASEEIFPSVEFAQSIQYYILYTRKIQKKLVMPTHRNFYMTLVNKDVIETALIRYINKSITKLKRLNK